MARNLLQIGIIIYVCAMALAPIILLILDIQAARDAAKGEAGLKAKNAQIKKFSAGLADELRRQKYKRCLALHDYAICELEFAFRDPCFERSVEGCVRWRKWANRWLDLAEYFRECK